jgi:ribosomal protein S18 acetylase RimI-like enzyme
MEIVYQGKTKKGNEIIIRYAENTDAVDMTRYINELSKEKTFITFQGEKISLKGEKKYLEDFIEKTNVHKAIKLLVINEGKIIGISDIFMGERTARHIGTFGITISKNFRGEGIGRLLMKLILKEAEENIPTLKILSLGVFANNPIAIKMYEEFGFTEYSRFPNGLLLDSGFEDELMMFKNIRQV